MRHLTDLQGDGFPLDGSCEYYQASDGSAEGKFGMRSHVGSGFRIYVSADKEVAAITMAFVGDSDGTITALKDNGESTTYDIRRIVVIPLNVTGVELTIDNASTEHRVEIASITPGISLSFTADALTKVELDLKSDLSIVDPSWQISSIEVKAYYPYDISEAISNMNDDVPITYYAGYQGSYSDGRKFYLSEAATMEDNIITLKGEDASHKLEDAKNIPLSRLDTVANAGEQRLYQWMRDAIAGTGMKLDYCETPPKASGSDKTARSLVLTDASPREHISSIMNLAHTGDFWPTLVDAGIPRLTWTKPTAAKWDIYETDCGDVERNVDRNLARLTTDDENGLMSNAARHDKWHELAGPLKIEKGEIYKRSFSDGYYWSYKIADKDRTVASQLDYYTWVASATTTKKKVKRNGRTKTVYKHRPTLYGKKLVISGGRNQIIDEQKRPGMTKQIRPIAYGRVYQGATFIYPNYRQMFEKNNVGGSFTWKGDPRMQPRDLFNFHRNDGTVELCTIESIELTHEGGGTQRKGTGCDRCLLCFISYLFFKFSINKLTPMFFENAF